MLLYNFIIRFYYTGIALSFFFMPKAKLWMQGRKGWKKKFTAIPFHENKWAWFHCCSFGEFQDGRSVIEAFRKKYPQHKILLTFHSPSGFELMKQYDGADLVFYLPLDTRSNADFFLDCLKPSIVFIIRNDIWSNYIAALSKRNIPFYLVSFTLSEKSKFLKFPQRAFYKKSFQQFTSLFVQDERAKELLDQNNFNSSIVVAGNCRVDRVKTIYEESFHFPELEKFVSGNLTIIAGSTLEKDRLIFIETFLALKNENIRWIIVPHEIHKSEIEATKQQLRNEMVCFTEIDQLNDRHKIVWIDHIGMLAKLYRYADIAFIGGGFNSIGIHNILEPAVSGCAICFGPNYRELPEAKDLLKLGAKIVRDANDLKEAIENYKNNKQNLDEIKSANKKYVKENCGATEKIFEVLENPL
jgi:3-deoxy-D-manno-octulosonic-acid transferase